MKIDQWLDEAFDRLSGTGAAGRRALIEAEDHLRGAAADAEAAGMSEDAAEADAVARFGRPALLARGVRGSWIVRLRPVFTGLWLGVAGVAAGVSVTSLRQWASHNHEFSHPGPHDENVPIVTRQALALVRAQYDATTQRTLHFALGSAVCVFVALVGYLVSRRWAPHPSSSRTAPLVAGVLLGFVGAVAACFALLSDAYGIRTATNFKPWELWMPDPILTLKWSAALACLVAGVAVLAERRVKARGARR